MEDAEEYYLSLHLFLCIFVSNTCLVSVDFEWNLLVRLLIKMCSLLNIILFKYIRVSVLSPLLLGHL